MGKVLLLGSSIGSREIIECAHTMGLQVIVTDGLRPEKSFAKRIADIEWEIDTGNTEELYKACIENQVCAVISGVSDFNCTQALKLSKYLNLGYYCEEKAWQYSLDKRKFKDLCKKLDIPVAKDYFLSNRDTKQWEGISYPVVVKPADQSGNKGVYYCNNENELRVGYNNAKLLSGSGNVIIEQRLEGLEYNVYYVIAQGKARLLNAATEHHQKGYPANLYSVITNITHSLGKYLDEIDEKICKLLELMGCSDGVCWIEFILDKGRFFALEMGYRLGSDMMCNQFKNFFGFDAVKWVFECSLGRYHSISDLPAAQRNPFKECICSYSIFTKKSGIIQEIQGLEVISTIKGITVDMVRFENDFVLENQLLGVITVGALDINELINIMKKINCNFFVFDTEGEDIMIHYTGYKELNDMYHESNHIVL